MSIGPQIPVTGLTVGAEAGDIRVGGLTEEEREAEIRQSQSLNRLISDMADPLSMPLIDINMVKLNMLNMASKQYDQQVKANKDAEMRYEEYKSRQKRLEDEYYKPFNNPIVKTD